MPTPLSDSISAVLRSDSTAALAALMIIFNAHREIFDFVARAISPDAVEPQPRANGNGVKRPATVYSRLAKRDETDERLLEALRANPDATISDWARAAGRSRSSVASDLRRLRDAGLVESIDRKWRLVEPREPPPRWVEPLHGRARAASVHMTAAG